jgi:hypothetical protein
MPSGADASIKGVVEDLWWPVVVSLATVGCVPPDTASEPSASAGGGPTPSTPQAATAVLDSHRADSRPAKVASSSRSTDRTARSVSSPVAAVGSDAGETHPTLSAARISGVFRDFFERSTLGPDYNATSGAWRIQGGRVCATRARNHPLWLRRKLPTNVRIEFDAASQSADGDLKVEAWGDGTSAATGVSYADASSYLFIYGGWKNSRHVLARLDEHGPNRKEVSVDPSGQRLDARPVRPHHSYHFKIERSDGKTVRWLVDDIEILTFADAQPLRGEGHEHFAFNDWDTPVCFDDLIITAL